LETVRTIDTVSGVRVDLVDDVLKQDISIATLPILPWSAADLPAPVVALDDLDVSLVDALAIDGHLSVRELARQLSVAHTTITARIRRLEDSGLLRVVAQRDPVAMGDVNSVGYVWIRTDGDQSDRLAATLYDRDDVVFLANAVGTCDLIALVTAATEDELATLITRELVALPGVRAVRSAPVVEALSHRSHLHRLAPARLEAR